MRLLPNSDQQQGLKYDRPGDVDERRGLVGRSAQLGRLSGRVVLIRQRDLGKGHLANRELSSIQKNSVSDPDSGGLGSGFRRSSGSGIRIKGLKKC